MTPHDKAAPPSMGFVERLKAELSSGAITLPAPEYLVSKFADAVHDKDIELGELVELLSRIPQVAARVLQLAGTPIYSNRGGRVSMLPEAIRRIGTKSALSLASTIVTQKAFMVVKGQFAKVAWKAWENALLSAILARMIGKRVPGIVNPDMAYLLGLYHNIGELLILRLGYELEEGGERIEPLAEVVHEIHAHHSEFGYMLCQAWNLDDLICKVALHHHDRSLYDSANGGSLPRACALPVLASQLALEWTGPYSPEHPPFPTISQCRELLGLSVIDCMALSESARGSMSNLVGVMSD